MSNSRQEHSGSATEPEAPTPLVKGDGETWQDYSHRLEHRIKEQREHIKAITELRNEPGDRSARKRIEWLERALGSMTLRWEKVSADFAGYREFHRTLPSIEVAPGVFGTPPDGAERTNV